MEQDQLLLTKSLDCKRMQQIVSDVQFSDEWSDLFYSRIGEDLESNCYGWLIAETKLNRDLYEESDIA